MIPRTSHTIVVGVIASMTTVWSPPTSLEAQVQDSDLTAPLAWDPAVRVGTLDNGLQYFVRENDRPLARAELRLLLKAGSVLEDDDQLGLAHFAEHMAFNGTRRFEKQALVDYLERIGMRFGPDLNAYTSFDETVYMLTVPTDVDSLLIRGFDILEDWASGVAFDPEEVEKERGVVIEEWRLGRGAQARIMDQQIPVLFHGSRYAERLPIGSVDVLRSFPREALVRFYEDWYRPDLMAVVAVGDFDAGRVEAMIRERFGPLTGPADPRPRPEIELPVHEETLFAIATDPEATTASVAVAWKLPLEESGTVGDRRRSFAESIYNGMLTRRMYEMTQRPGAPFLFGGSGKGRFVGSVGVYQLIAGVEDGGILRGLEGVLTEAERVQRFGFTESELEREKTEILRGLEVRYDEREHQESDSYASQYVYAFLVGTTPQSESQQLELGQALLPTITLAEIDRLAESWLADEGRVILVSAPEKPDVRLPGEEELLAAFSAARTAEITPYEDDTADEPLLAALPEPGPVVHEERIEEVDLTRWRLSNGVRVLVRPTDFKEDELIVSAYSPGGTSLVSDDEFHAVQMATTLITRGGVADFDFPQLQKKLAGKVALVAPTISDLEEGFFGMGSWKDAETMFQLVHLYATRPRMDPGAMEALMTQVRGSIENRDASPQSAFMDTVLVTMSRAHPRMRPFTLESAELLDLERSYVFYEDRFADFSDFTFTIVGSFEVEELRPLVERYLGSLPGTGRVESWQDVGIDPPTGVVQKTVRRGVEPQSRTRIVFAGETDHHSREESLALGALAEALEIRLREVLREDLGGTYSVSASGGLSRRPDTEYNVTISFGSAPERADELFDVVMAEIDRVRREGPGTLNVDKVKESRRRTKETNLRENAYWARQIESFDREGLDPRDIPSFDVIDAWTDESLRELAVKYLRDDRYVRVVLLPERPSS